jgi:hypothetical protein
MAGTLIALAPGHDALAQAEDLFSGVTRLEQIQAEKGDPVAQYFLARRLESGNGVAQDLNAAIEWYRRAADGGQVEAQYRLGQIYADGLGPIEADETQAEAWFSLAALNGSAAAQAWLDRANAPPEPEPEPVARPAPPPPPPRAVRPAPPRVETPPPAPRPAARPAPPPARPAPPPARVAVVTPPPPAPKLDTQAIVLAGGWTVGEEASLMLPSTATSCLAQGAAQMVCFSKPQRVNISGQSVTFSVKTTLSGFQETGAFQAQPMYQVTDLGGNDGTPRTQIPPGLRAQQGWIDPGITAPCKASGPGAVRCEMGPQGLEFARK